MNKPHYGPHTFFIPVMGTGFTIDTPLRVAKFGISSVMSLSDDVLIEKMRKHHSALAGEEYESIRPSDPDCRSLRITAYLNLVNRIVQRQIAEIRSAPFTPGSDITRYFEMQPETEQKARWRAMLAEEDPVRKARLEQELRDSVSPGNIDVNIMTKVDPEIYKKGVKLAPEFGLAQQAMKGFAQSDLSSSVVFSAGLNPGLYTYTANFPDFFPGENGALKKQIILKVSDYRSALVQGRFLAKRGLWVSEFRIESGINCGGHAFVNRAPLMGPVLEEFLHKRSELFETLMESYSQTLEKLGRPLNGFDGETRITAQGGIGTADEKNFLISYYGLDATGWGTPFLLVPEVVSIDPEHLQKLALAESENDVHLSDASPLGVPFWLLRNSASEENRKALIESGKPGSSCPRGYLKFNKEFTEEPICTASSDYMSRKLPEVEQAGGTAQGEEQRRLALAKACLCRDLAGSAFRTSGAKPNALPTICPGPNITNFSVVASLREMVDHIYGRISLMTNPKRPHMFLREMSLYIERMRETVANKPKEMLDGLRENFHELEEKILSGFKYYSDLAANLATDKKKSFLQALENVRAEFVRVREGVLENLGATLSPNPA